MAGAPDWDDYAARSMRNGRRDNRGRDGQRQSQQRGYSKDEDLYKAIATVRRAFPTLFHDLCESCQGVLESRLTRLAEGGSKFSSVQSESSSRNTSYDQQHFSYLDASKGVNPSANTLNSFSNYTQESSTTSGEEESYDQNFPTEDSYGSFYVNAENSENYSDVNPWGSTRKKLQYPETLKEQYGDTTSWPALGSSNHQKHSIPEWSRHEENVKHNGELISNVKTAPWSSRNVQYIQGSQQAGASYRNTLNKLSNLSLHNSAGTTASGSRDSNNPPTTSGSRDSNNRAVVWTSHSNNSGAVPRYSERAVLTEANEGKSNGPAVTGQDNSDSDQREWLRFREVVAKKDFEFWEHVNGRMVNVLQGLELHTNILNSKEQEKLIEFALELQNKGRNKELMGRTYSEPRKWMRGKGRVTIQFGCCYNYAEDRAGNPPGIVRDETVDPLPRLLKATIKRLVRWHVLPPSCVPDSCIINIYDEGDCIPPHIDHHDFVRPFCTLSLLSQCNIVFGSTLKIIGPGEFEGPVKIPLPVGSVLVLNGNGADVAKHAVPAVPTKRISITFRKMDPCKVPHGFVYEKDLQNLTPL